MSSIPKKIHWIWFGGNSLSPKMQACVASWKTVMPDYEIIKWDENNFDVSQSPYAAAAYEAGQYAFVSDIARQIILREHGGIYLDTDVEALKPLDEFLDNKGFMSFKDSRSIFGITSGIIGSQADNPLLTNIIDNIEREGFVEIAEGIYKTVSYVLVDQIKKLGIQIKNEKQVSDCMTLYPYEYLCPKISENGDIEITDNTHLVHYFADSWVTDKMLKQYKKLAAEKPELFKQE